jgi:hypothetical protein
MRFHMSGGLLVGFVLTLAASVFTIPASADTAGADKTGGADVQVVQALKNQATGLCLDHSFEFGVRVFDCNGGEWQRWTLSQYGDGTWRIRNGSTGGCLGASSTTAVTIHYDCAPIEADSWWLRQWGDGTWEVKNQLTGTCLDFSHQAGRLRLHGCNATQYQSWWRT